MSAAWPELEGAVDQSDIDDLERIERELASASSSPGSYTSPLMARLSAQRLTVEMLAREVPRLRSGQEAQEALASGLRGVRKQREAREAVAAGEQAKERLFAAALPLIRTVASREWRRRQQWGSQVSLDDLTQDAIVGFFKGLSGFKPEAMRRSATNYLGQWMLVEMRRSAEAMDHDLQVGHDAGERFRRVRALRSRLMGELGREPTDAEISDASRNPAYLTRPGMVGRAPRNGEQPAMGKGLTVEQVAEERINRPRSGHVARFVASGGDREEDVSAVIDQERFSLNAYDGTDTMGVDPGEVAADAGAAKAVSSLIEKVIETMGLPEQQREIVGRRFGLHPYMEEASAREISRTMGVNRERVTRVLAAFSQEMTRPGGAFHRVTAAVPSDDLLALGLGWVPNTLGPWDPKLAQSANIPGILIDPIGIEAHPPPPEPSQGSTLAVAAFTAWYHCDFHDKVFTAAYPDLRQVPKDLPCPSCQRPSPLAKTTAGT